MGLLSRSPRTPRPARVPRQRVRLSQEELRGTSRLQPIERKIAFVLAALTAVLMVIAWLDVGLDTLKYGPARLAGGLAAAAVLALAARGRSRFLVGLAAVLNVWFWPTSKDAPLYQLAAYPSLLFMMFLMLRMSNDRRKAMEARALRGDTDLPRTASSPRARKRRGRGGGAEPDAEAAVASRPVAPPSKRYTPPKHRPAKTRR